MYTILILIEAQPQQHLSASIFECHGQLQMIQDTVKSSCLSETFISERER